MNARDYAILFSTEPDGELRGGWQSGVLRQRAKTIRAGEMLYCESYPIWDTAAGREARKKLGELKRRGSTEAQKRLNIRNAKKKIIRKINANFGVNDLLCTFTYPDGGQPGNEDEAIRNMRNFVRRIRTLCRHKELPDRKYIYITETTSSAARGTRYHHHMILTGEGLTREKVETCWYGVHKGISNTRRYQDQEAGMTGFVMYMLKGIGADKGQQIVGRRKWSCSKNLTPPKETTADKKISRRRVEQIARDIENRDTAKEIFEKLYPGYRFVEIEVRTSEFVTGAYIYATMKRIRNRTG